MSNRYKIYLIAFVGFLVSTSQFMIAGVLDKLAIAFNISVSDAGQLVTIFAITSGFGTPFVVMYLSKYNLKIQLVITLVIFLISTIITPLSPNYTFLMIVRAITGLFTSTFIVIAYTIASKLAKEGKQGSAIADVALGLSLALVVGIPFGRYITLNFDWQAIFWIIAALVFVGTLLIIWLIPRLENHQMIPVLEQLSFFKKPKIVLPLAMTFFVFSAYSIINTYVTPLLLNIDGISEHQIGITFFLIGIASLFGSKLGASLADKFGVSPIVFMTITITMLSLAALSLLFTYTLVTLMLVLLTASIWMFGPTQSLKLSKVAPHATGIVIGLNSSVVQLGFAAGAGIGGVAIGAHSVVALGYSAAIIAFVAIIVALYERWLFK